MVRTKPAAASEGPAVVKTSQGSVGKTTPAKGKGSPKGKGKKSSKRTLKKAEKKSGMPSFHLHIHRVLKQVHPNQGISKVAMTIMNSFACDMFERLASESATLLKYTSAKTLSARALQTSVRLLLPGELSKHAISEGTKAVTKYTNATRSSKD
jgi:histone H2B